MAPERLKIPGILQTRAAFEPSTFDEKAGTVEVVFTTGARGLRRTWMDGTFYEELEVSERALDLSRLNNGAPLLDNHDRYSGVRAVLGVIEKAWIQGKEGRALVRFSEREDVKPVKEDVKNGILRHTSVGYSIQKLEKVEEVEKVPVYRATRWAPFEISLTPVGFDDKAVVRSQQDQEFHEVEIVSTAEENRAMPDPIAPAAAAPAAHPPAAAAAVTQPPEDATRAAAELATRAERERATVIRSLVAKHKLGPDFEARLLGDEKTPGATLEKARAMILDELAARSDAQPPNANGQHVRVEAGEDEREKFRRGIEAALLVRAGVAGVVQAAKKTPVGAEVLRDVATDPGEFRWIRSYSDLARACLERSTGKSVRLSGDDLFAAALGRSGAYATTSDFPVALAGVMHKTFLGAYLTAPDGWRSFAAVRPASDFRVQNFYRAGSFGPLQTLNEHGEIAQIAIPDVERSQYQVGTKAGRFAITRQVLVNDDMGVFNDVGARGGRAAGLTIERDVFALLALNGGLGPAMLDGNTLFHALHGNIGAQAALSVAAIDADAALMSRQTDVTGNEVLDLQPAVLLVERALRGTALNINDAEFDPDLVANKGSRVPNKCRGMFRSVVASPRFAAGATRRYLFADPAQYPALIVAFLSGEESPKLESRWGFEVEGVEFKIVLDFGVAAVDWRPAITNAG